MASISTMIHLGDEDKPQAWRLETGRISVWLNGPGGGATVIGSDHALSKLRDEIDQFLAQPKAEAA